MKPEHQDMLKLLKSNQQYTVGIYSVAGLDILSVEEFENHYNPEEKNYVFYDENRQPLSLLQGNDDLLPELQKALLLLDANVIDTISFTNKSLNEDYAFIKIADEVLCYSSIYDEPVKYESAYRAWYDEFIKFNKSGEIASLIIGEKPEQEEKILWDDVKEQLLEHETLKELNEDDYVITNIVQLNSSTTLTLGVKDTQNMLSIKENDRSSTYLDFSPELFGEILTYVGQLNLVDIKNPHVADVKEKLMHQQKLLELLRNENLLDKQVGHLIEEFDKLSGEIATLESSRLDEYLKDTFKNLEQLLPISEKFELNRRDGKKIKADDRFWIPERDRPLLGDIDNDFIRVYKFEDGSSIGFGFNNYSYEEIEDMIVVSAYRADGEVFSKNLNADDGTKLVRGINKHYKHSDFNIDDFIDFCKLESSDMQKRLDDSLREFTRDNIELLTSKAEVKKELRRIKEPLEKDLTEINRKVAEYKASLIREGNIASRSSKVAELERQHKELSKSIIINSSYSLKESLAFQSYISNEDISTKVSFNQFSSLVQKNLVDKELDIPLKEQNYALNISENQLKEIKKEAALYGIEVQESELYQTDDGMEQWCYIVDEARAIYSQNDSFSYSRESDIYGKELYRTELMDFRDYEESIDGAISAYYDTLDELQAEHPEIWRQIVLECAFEQEYMTSNVAVEFQGEDKLSNVQLDEDANNNFIKSKTFKQ